MRLKSGDGLCEALRGTRVINIGDSLTHQLVETWRARRIASSWPIPDGFAYKKSEEGHLSKEIDLANEFARQSRGGRRRRRLGPHKEARENAEREARQRSDADERCSNGAAFQFIEPQRPWSLVPWAFQEHDPSVAKCGVAFRNQTRDFATRFCRVLSFPSVAVAEPRSRRSSLRESPRLSLGPPPRRRRADRPQAQGERVIGLAGGLRQGRDRDEQEEAREAEEAARGRAHAHGRGLQLLRAPGEHRAFPASCWFLCLRPSGAARLAWTYPCDFAITRDILPPNTPSTQALEVMNCYAEEAPDRFPTSACRRGVVSRGLSTR